MAGATGSYELDPEIKSTATSLGKNTGDAIWAKQQEQAKSMVEPFRQASGGNDKNIPAAGGMTAPIIQDRPELGPRFREKNAQNELISRSEKEAGPGGAADFEMSLIPREAIPPRETTPPRESPGSTTRGSFSPGVGEEMHKRLGIPPAGEGYVKPEIVAGGPGNAIATFRGGVRSLADKENEEGGPAEFDFGAYKSAIKAIGGKPGLKTRLAILGHMMGEHEKRQDFQRKLKELDITHGEGSPAMIGARSEAEYRKISGERMLAMAPHEIEKSIQESAHLKARTEEIPYDIAYKRSMTEYHNSIIQMKEFSNESAYLKILSDVMEKGIPTDPDVIKAKKEFDDIVNRKKGDMMVERAERQNPKLKGRIRWVNGKYEEIK